jgi:prepilin-type N-terminal cleavage/methylation domain-containing protein
MTMPLHRPLPPGRPRRPGFTLIELLTVITIIGILAAILVPVVSTAIISAKKNKSLAQLNNLVTMVTMYKQAYKVYPTLGEGAVGADTALSLKQSGETFYYVMTGNTTQGSSVSTYNKQGIPFASFNDSDLNTTYDPTTPIIVDAFGNSDIYICMDTNYDNQIDASVAAVTMTPGPPGDPGATSLTITQTVPVHSGVIAASPGNGVTNDDIVTTWVPQ